jgi:hypothetical protein
MLYFPISIPPEGEFQRPFADNVRLLTFPDLLHLDLVK